MNAQEYATVIKSICSKLSIGTPDDTIIRNVSSYCKRLNHKELKQRYPDDSHRYEMIVKSYLNSIQPRDEYEFDPSSLLSRSSKKEEPLTTSWIDQRMPTLSSKAMSIYVDSRLRNADVTQSDITDFVFSLVPRQTKTQVGDGHIQARVMPSQITYLKIGAFAIPYDESFRVTNSSREVTLTFTALRSNGMIGQDETYHFAFTYEPITASIVKLTPINKYCKFSPPLRMIDNLSLRFNDPIYPIQFMTDRLIPSSFNYMSSDGRIEFATQHKLNAGDVIVIDGLTTDDDAANKSILSKINNPRGVVVTPINLITISIGIDFTQLITPSLTSLPQVFIYSRSFRFPLEIGYQDVSELS